MEGKLRNQEFTAKAPPEVITDHQDRLTSLRKIKPCSPAVSNSCAPCWERNRWSDPRLPTYGAPFDCALQEDLPLGDVTTAALFPSPTPALARIVAQQSLVVAGLAAAVQTFRTVDASLVLSIHRQDGDTRTGWRLSPPDRRRWAIHPEGRTSRLEFSPTPLRYRHLDATVLRRSSRIPCDHPGYEKDDPGLTCASEMGSPPRRGHKSPPVTERRRPHQR